MLLDPEAHEEHLASSNPFAGALPAKERWEVLKAGRGFHGAPEDVGEQHHQLVVAETVTVLFGIDHAGQEVVSRAGASGSGRWPDGTDGVLDVLSRDVVVRGDGRRRLAGHHPGADGTERGATVNEERIPIGDRRRYAQQWTLSHWKDERRRPLVVVRDQIQVLTYHVMKDALTRVDDGEETELLVVCAAGVVVEHRTAIRVELPRRQGMFEFSLFGKNRQCLAYALHRQTSGPECLDN